MMTDEDELPHGQRAHARRDDPETSHDAAASVAVRESQAAVLAVFTTAGPMTDEELHDTYLRAAFTGTLRPQSSSGLRTRRSELVRLGYICWTGERRVMRTGRLARVWGKVQT